MRVLDRSVFLIVFLFTLNFFNPSNALHAQQKGSIKVGGPCMQCVDHLIAFTKGIDGVSQARLDPATGQLYVEYNSNTSLLDISLELSLAGYDAGDFRRDSRAKLPPCCQSGTRGDAAMDTEELPIDDTDLDEGDWENPDNLDALDRLSEHKSGSVISDEDLEIEEDEDIEILGDDVDADGDPIDTDEEDDDEL